MARPKNSPGNGEVKVERVDRIRPVYNAVSKPSVYGNPRSATVTRKPAAADVAISRKNSGTKLLNGVASPDDIQIYIDKKKREFVLGV